MMRIRIRRLLWAVAGVCVSVLPAIGAPLIVPDYGDTGWQTYSHEFPPGWRGTFGIGVANFGDMANDSQLLIDHINMGPPGNSGFETGDFTGFTVFGSNSAIVACAFSDQEVIYEPTEGSYMASIQPSYYYDEATGWLDYEDADEWGGKNGVYLTFSLNVPGGATLSFDWAFLARDEYPHADFAFVFSRGEEPTPEDVPFQIPRLMAAVIPGGDAYSEIIARIGEVTAVSEPGTLVLLGLGISGISMFRKKKQCLAVSGGSHAEKDVL